MRSITARGTSGRAMLDALVTGTTDPEVLADLAKGRLRQKLPALREASEGRFNDLHALLIDGHSGRYQPNSLSH